MNLARLTALAAATVEATQRSLPPEIRPLAQAVPVHYEAAPHPDVLAEGFEPDILGLFIGSPHGTGVVERVFVHSGTITVGPASEPITLGPGDYARYSGDGPHVYRSAGEGVRGMLLVGYPPA